MSFDFNRPDSENEAHGGIQKHWSFDNGYATSVVQHSFSYGRENGNWELAIMHDNNLCYSTPITDDVMGNLTEKEVLETLELIKALSKKEK